MILPPACLGVLGGGQLGRFFVAAAHEMGYRVWVMDPDAGSPAGKIADRHLQADYRDEAALLQMAENCQAITTEFENVPASSLARLAARVQVHPAAAAVAVCQNRIEEKAFFARHGIPHGEYAVILSAEDIRSLSAVLFPAILKTATLGYDGKGQRVVTDPAEALAAFEAFHHQPCVLECRLPLECEISVILARNAQGEVQCYPPVENRHRYGILDVSIAPARIAAGLLAQAQTLAMEVARELDYVGTLAIEFFVSEGRLLANEIAPRPHNSGHHTLDACRSSQYEQQVRALAGLPLATAEQHSVAVMVNLLGDLWFRQHSTAAQEPDWRTLFDDPALALHMYTKQEARPGRKMGHFCVTGGKMDAVYQSAMSARARIGIQD